MHKVLMLRISILMVCIFGALCSFIIAVRAQSISTQFVQARLPGADLPQVNLPQVSLPQYGWKVCQDLGESSVPGLDGTVQILKLCRNSGWQILVHCIDVGMAVPPLGSTCEMYNGTDFSCGGGVQRMRVFQIVETPAPAPTSTLTPTLTLTSTATATQTATNTAAATRAQAATYAATSQRQATQAAATRTAIATRAAAASTRYVRTRPGGQGNLGLVLSLSALLTGAALWLAALGLRAQSIRKP